MIETPETVRPSRYPWHLARWPLYGIAIGVLMLAVWPTFGIAAIVVSVICLALWSIPAALYVLVCAAELAVNFARHPGDPHRRNPTAQI